MIYEDAMKYITQVGNFGSNYGLERTERILEILGNPHKKLKLIHIAGTNGKGSTTAIVTEILKGQGFKVGMYTSPFLEEFEERIQINGVNIPKGRLGELVGRLKVAVDRVIEEEYNHPTEFEIITCLMLLYFCEEEVDYGVIEVGLGGRLDSTNVITPIVSVITSISFDHVNLLGNTLGEIAFEKAGIIKKNVPVVIFPQQDEALSVIEKVANDKGAKIFTVNSEGARFNDVIEDGNKVYQRIKLIKDNNSLEIDLGLLGEHQIVNMLVAIKTYEVVCSIEKRKFKIQDIKDSIKNVAWIGRLEVMRKSPLVVIDGAHNIQGILTLKRNVRKYFKYNRMFLLLGILADKQVEEMVATIAPEAYKVITLTPNSNRAELALELKTEVDKYNNNCFSMESYEGAFKEVLKEAKEDDLILVSGSLYMIGDMRRIIRRNN